MSSTVTAWGKEIASELGNLCVCGTYQRIHSAVAGL